MLGGLQHSSELGFLPF